jgi:enoyl-CoA hydratase
LAGLARAKELVFTGKVISAQEAYEMGLVNKVVADGELTEAVRKLAASIASAGPVGVGLAKACINKSLSLDIDSGLDYEAEAFGICFGTEDQKEGMTAFLEKRKPTYRGR